jgi:hypothetical protein
MQNHSLRSLLPVPVLLATLSSPAAAVDIVVDYRYDTNGFFTDGINPDAATARAALEAATARWSAILGSGNLGAAAIDPSNSGRIGFTHPGTGDPHEVSGASGTGLDALVSVGAPAADEYRSITFNPDEWILYAGGRDLTSAGVGGTGTGLNFESTRSDPNSHLNRGFGGFDLNLDSVGIGNLPTWGGAISFDSSGTDFSYDGDFYSIALHEVGHALGLSTNWGNFQQHVTGDQYAGPAAVSAFNADNGASASFLSLESDSNPHWLDNGPADQLPVAAQSFIFAPANPDYSNTVGPNTLQDLNMEPTLNFLSGGSNPRLRYELTNVDIGAAEDIGWVVIPEPSTVALLLLASLGLGKRRR